MATEKEIALLSRVATNHLFLAQFEPLRAALLSLRKRHPDLASSFLRTIVSEGGQVEGVHWSTTCPSPSHLAWLASLELNEPHSNRLQVEFLILIQTALSKLTEEIDTDLEKEYLNILSRLLDLGVERLKGQNELDEVSEEELTCLSKVFLKYADIFDAISVNIRNQASLQQKESGSSREGIEAIMRIPKSVQLANLREIKDFLDGDVIEGIFCRLPFLHHDFGVEEEEYKNALKELVMKCCSASCSYNSTFFVSRRNMSQVYAGLVQSSCTRLLHMLQVIQDEVFLEEIKKNGASSTSESVPLSLKKFLATTAEEREKYAGACIRDLYHYSRVSEKHVLELVVETSLYLIRKEQLQEASDVVSLFPLLYPLVAVLGWDMLSGNILLRRKLMWLFWRSKSKLLTEEKLFLHDKPSEKLSCFDYLCDLLCFELDVANYIAHEKSGQLWGLRNTLFFSETDTISSEETDLGCVDPFVENLILEKLSFQSPIRILFETVPGIRFEDVIKFIKSQPVSSDRDAERRLRDIELVHMKYALESAIFSLSYIGRSSDNEEEDFQIAMSYLGEMQSHMESIQDFSRKVFMVIIVSSLFQIDHISIKEADSIPLSSLNRGTSQVASSDMVMAFIKTLLNIMRRSLAGIDSKTELLKTELGSAVKQAFEWRLSNARDAIDDMGWRFSLLQRLKPTSRKWCWREALVILRGSPAKLLTLCMQRREYGIGEEIALRFSLPPEDKATLKLTRWIADSSPKEDLNASPYRDQLGQLATAFLYIDGATTIATSRDKCTVLLDHTRRLLSEIDTRKPPKVGPTYWEQIQEAALVSMMKRVIQCLQENLESEQSQSIQDMFVQYIPISPSNDTSKLGQMQRPLVLLHQTIDDAFKGKTQFLNGKLHNIAKALTDEDSDGSKREASCYKKGMVFGLGLRVLKSASKVAQKPITVPPISENGLESKESCNRIFTPLPANPSAYLSNFIIYIATIGDIFDGVDTTHNFNYFSLIYDWPKDLLTQLVFERGSTDAAEKAAEAMGVDFVHEIISSCVPPVFPPRSSHSWAWMPVYPVTSENTNSPKSEVSYKSALTTLQKPLYPLQLEVLKTLANLSPVRAVLAGVFGSSLISGDSEAERSYYEFALEQSERYPTLNRWIQVQSNLHRVSESALASKTGIEQKKERSRLKRLREPEQDTETKANGPFKAESLSTSIDLGYLTPKEESEIADVCFDQNACISFDDDEGPYEAAVEKLINEGKLMDALAVSDKCLRDGASDQLLQLLIENVEETQDQLQSSSHNFESGTWQYCLRLRDKKLAAHLALKHLHKWDSDAAINVLSMCICHLPEADPLRNEIFQKRRALQRYRHILSADDRYNNWQEVEASCKADGEGLALRLASKGAVSAALEVAESASLSANFRRELQGRQLVKLLTTDPLSGGGPAAASRFLSSLRDSDDALPVAIGAMELLPDLRSKQLLVHFFLKRSAGNFSATDLERLNSWALGLRVLALLPLPQQQKCSALHEYPRLILEVLLMMKQLQSASLVLKEFPSLRDDNLILKYAQKAISINVSSPRENRISISSTRPKQKKLTTTAQPPKLSITESIGNLQKRAFSWGSRDNGGSSTPVKSTPNSDQRKRKSSNLGPTERASPGERLPNDVSERVQFVSVSEEWVLTGDPVKDDEIRSAHRYSSSPDIALFKALLSLCSDELVAAKGAVNLCITQMQTVLSCQYLPRSASMEIMSRAYHATETYVQALAQARSQLRKTPAIGSDTLSSSESSHLEGDRASITSGGASPSQGEVSDLLGQAELWLGRAELLQSLLGSGISASLEDTIDKDSSSQLRDRLIKDELYSMAIYTCKKCKINAFPVWNAWGHALIRMEHYAQARVKFKQAVQLYNGDPTQVVLEIINAVEGSPPVDISSARSMYENLAKSAASILDDSLSADAYLNVLYMPSTFPRSERSRQSMNSRSILSGTDIIAGPRSNLDTVRYAECIHYLQEYARPQLLLFMFKHGHYEEACSLFLQSSFPSLQLEGGGAGSTSSIQRADSLANDYGSVDDLCELCIGYGAMSDLAGTLQSSMESPAVQQDQRMKEHVLNLLIRICNYCETHRHFNYLYQFLVIRGDDVAAGLCCIQLFMNSMSQEEALKHLANAKVHFDEAALARDRPAGPLPRMVPKNATRIKSASDKMTKEMIMKFSPRVSFQIDVVKALNALEGPQWKTSLFGNPSDPETFRRRCVVVETLAEKHFNLAFQILHEFNLPAVDIYAGVVTNLGLKKRSREITEFLKNIKGTIEDDEWDQVVSTAISIYVTKHKERPDKLVDMIKSSHRKVLALVICGRLKGAFQVASRSGSVADVQYVAHQVIHFLYFIKIKLIAEQVSVIILSTYEMI
ncbi:hypothetical protein LUZ63_019326 [Rhynchospora breviuscula]|uniref:ZFYVE26-like TPR repeats domain-containing protein n=1 Tax=Rhynchospora breviuscula TaxID=2022672 RepID=A0A9Q0C5Z6_9POAL|nr:hypothetical protein LUZ63_019326 [Rhynchospora breviuscula]